MATKTKTNKPKKPKKTPAKKAKVKARNAARAVPVLGVLPVMWKHAMGVQSVGLWVERDRPGRPGHVWAGNDKGEIAVLTKAGVKARSFQVPKHVHALFVDAAYCYAACNDGSVYDLTALPKPAPVVKLGTDMSIGWIEAHRGRLCVADAEGGLTVFDVEKHILWEKRSDDAKESWMVRPRDDGVYYGCEAGLFAYDWSGALKWHIGAGSDIGDVRFGDVIDDDIVVTAGWGKLKQTHMHVVTRSGKPRWSVRLKPGPGGEKPTGAESCCAARDLLTNKHRFYASSGAYVFCFDDNGKGLWRAATGFGSACNMVVEGERLYVVTSDGTVACVDVSEEAIAQARKAKREPASAPDSAASSETKYATRSARVAPGKKKKKARRN